MRTFSRYYLILPCYNLFKLCIHYETIYNDYSQGLKSIVILDFDDFLFFLHRDIVTDPPACYRSPTYATMYGYEEAKIMHQIDRRKLRDMTGRYSYKW